MCWFLCNKNVKDGIHDDKEYHIAKYHDMILKDLDTMHYSRNYGEFCMHRDSILTKWSTVGDINLENFKQYFIKQWLQGDFCNWQLFITPPGYATTNNCEESFNFQIKETYTEFEKLTVLDA